MGGEPSPITTTSRSGRRTASRPVPLETYGVLHVLVNNRHLARPGAREPERRGLGFVINVHLKGHFVPTRHAANYCARRPRPVIRQGRDHQHVLDVGLLGNIVNRTTVPPRPASPRSRSSSPKSSVVTACARTRSPPRRDEDDRVDAGLSDHVVAPTDASVFDTWTPQHLAAGRDARDGGLRHHRSGLLRAGGTVRKFRTGR